MVRPDISGAVGAADVACGERDPVLKYLEFVSCALLATHNTRPAYAGAFLPAIAGADWLNNAVARVAVPPGLMPGAVQRAP